MKNNEISKLTSKTEKDLNIIDYFQRKNFKNAFPYSDVPYRSKCTISSDNFQWINVSSNNNKEYNVYSGTTEQNAASNFVIYPTISYVGTEKNLEKIQENNNYCRNGVQSRTLHSVGYDKKYTAQQLCAKHDSNNISHFIKSNSHVSTFESHKLSRSIVNVEIKECICNKHFVEPQFSKAEAILNYNLQKHLIPCNMENKIVNIPLCKPPLSPFNNGLHRNQKSGSSRIEDQLKYNEDDTNLRIEKLIKVSDLIGLKTDSDQYTSSNDGEYSTKENELDEESDFCEKAEELELLENLDSENIINSSSENANEEAAYDSASEEMLKEVHRLFHSTSINGDKSPLINSIFKHISPVIRFVREGESVSPLPSQYQSKLKWKLSSLTPNVVKRAAKRSGFKLITKGLHWSGYFGRHMKLMGFKSILEHQKFNHLPGSFQIGRKDRLWRNVSVLASKNGKSKDFNFLPKTYCLPGDMKTLKQAWDEEDSSKKAKWILKPPASARGIGIKVISKWSQVPKKRPAIVQNYISRPFLIDGSKFDLRIYVAVTSCDPLRIYVHKDGLARFASHKYSKSYKNISNRFIHLTNYSVNKKNENYTSNENHEKCQGHKWSLKALWKYMEEDLNIDWKPIWKNIKDCIVKTIIAVESNINSNVKMYCAQKNCVYELFGFDVLLDNKLKPWVIEVNVSPSLHSNSPLDIEVKSGMIADLFNLVGFQLYQAPDDSSIMPLSQTRRPSLSASSIPNHMSNFDQTYLKTNQKQSSLSSLNKSSRKSMTGKSKSMEKNELGNSQSHDSLPILQTRDTIKNSRNLPKSGLLKRKKTSMSMLSNTDTLSQSSQDILDPSLFQQSGYYSRVLTPNEKLKHIYYIQKGVFENQLLLSTITDKLTIDDVRILIESLDEFNRAGDFELIFPTSSEEGDKYMTYLYNNSGNRYYNILLHKFMKKFQANDSKKDGLSDVVYTLIRQEGIKVLENYSNSLFLNENGELWTNPCIKSVSRNISNCRSNSAGTLSISK